MDSQDFEGFLTIMQLPIKMNSHYIHIKVYEQNQVRNGLAHLQRFISHLSLRLKWDMTRHLIPNLLEIYFASKHTRAISKFVIFLQISGFLNAEISRMVDTLIITKFRTLTRSDVSRILFEMIFILYVWTLSMINILNLLSAEGFE